MIDNTQETFIKECASIGVSPAVASMYWEAKRSKSSVANIYAILAEENEIEEYDARNLLLDFYKDFIKKISVPSNIPAQENSALTFARNSLSKLIGDYTSSTVSKHKSDDFILIGGDLHSVWADKDAVDAFLDAAKYAKTVYLAGDLLDFYSVSRFNKNVDHLTVREELAFTRSFLEELSKRSNEVKVLTGNHDLRPTKILANNYPQLLPLLFDPLEILASNLSNVEVLKHTSEGLKFSNLPNHQEYLNTIHINKDLVVSHHEKFAGATAAEDVLKFVEGFRDVLGVKEKVRVVAQAHTHRLSNHFLNGTQLILTGCLCQTMPYQLEAGTMFRTTKGFVILEEGPNGQIDQNKTRLIAV